MAKRRNYKYTQDGKLTCRIGHKLGPKCHKKRCPDLLLNGVQYYYKRK